MLLIPNVPCVLEPFCGYYWNVVVYNAMSLELSPHVEGLANKLVYIVSKYICSFLVDQSYTCIGENTRRIPDRVGKVIGLRL